MKFTKLALLLTLFSFNLEAESLKDFIEHQEHRHKISATDTNKTIEINPFYQGEIVSIEQADAYTYMEVKEKTNQTFWIVTNSAEAKIGDYIRFQKELVIKDFKSKTLDKTFNELMFASNLEYRVSK